MRHIHRFFNPFRVVLLAVVVRAGDLLALGKVDLFHEVDQFVHLYISQIVLHEPDEELLLIFFFLLGDAIYVARERFQAHPDHF